MERQAVSASRRARSVMELARSAVLLSAVVASVGIEDGTTNFAVNGALLSLSLVMQLLHLPNFYRLSMVWTFAYIYVVVLEGYFDGPAIAHDLHHRFDVAAQYLNGANCIFLFAHSVVFREGNQPQQTETTEQRNKPRGELAVLFVAAVTLFTVVQSLPDAIRMLQSGRIGAETDAIASSPNVWTPIVAGFSSSASLSAPAMWLYYFVVLKKRPLYYALPPSLPIFLLQFASGTRFMLLISLIGTAIVYFSLSGLSARSLRQVTSIGAVAYAISAVMRQIRTAGVSAVDASSVLGLLDPGDYEGCARVMSQIVDYFSIHEHLYGKSMTAVLFFWIPRALWPSKPTLLGWWFPRAYSGTSGFSAGHSVSGGFPADAYVDFGFVGGLFVWALLGVAFGLLERQVDRMIRVRKPTLILAGCLYGATFFAVRSPDTALIVMSGVVLMTWLFGVALSSERPSPSITNKQR